MPFNYKVGNFQLNTVTGNQAITGVGFQPKAILFFHNSATVDVGVPQIANHYGMVGMTDGTTHRSVWWFEPNGNAGLESTGYIQSSYPICGGNNLSPTTWYANLVSLDGDGFTINVTTAPPDVYRVGYMAIGGADVTDVFVGEFTGTSGSQAVTGLGFMPTGLIMTGLGSTATLLTSGNAYSTNAHSKHTFGVSDGTFSRCTGLNFRDAALGTKINGKTQESAIVASANHTGANTYAYKATLTSFDVDGFTVNWTVAGGGKLFFLAFAGPLTQVGFFTNPTSTGTFIPVSGLAFQPNALITLSSCQTTFGNIEGNSEVANGPGAAYSYGFATDSMEQFNIEAASLDFTAGATYSGFYQSELAVMTKFLYNNRSTLQEQIAFDSFGTDDVTLDALTVLGAGTSQVSYMVIEGDGGGPPPVDPTGGSGGPDSPDSIFLQRFIEL
jgi:hypothetical protein